MRSYKLVVLFATLTAIGCQQKSHPVDESPTASSAPPVVANASPPDSSKSPNLKTSTKAVIDGHQTDLVAAVTVVHGLVEDLKYATADNFMKRKLYDDPTCYLLEDTARKLSVANAVLAERNPGFNLKVLDCYRPMSVQVEMWREYTNTPYVANPKTARHPRGRAVDITIVDGDGKEIEMPTEYDNFTPKAHPNAPATPRAAANRDLLRSVMVSAGFTGVTSEWWHFDNLAGSNKPK